MKRLWLYGLLFLAGSAQATAQLWLGGTRPYETVPYREMDTELYSSFAPDGSAPGLRLEYGILDSWMLLGSGEYESQDAAWGGSLGTRYRFADPGAWPLDAALFYDVQVGQLQPVHRLGLVLAKDLGDSSLALNLGQEDFQSFTGSLGFLSPLLTYTLRAGLDIQYTGQGGAWPVTPELVSQLPGDVSLEIGARFPGDGHPPTWLLSLSYEIFPSP